MARLKLLTHLPKNPSNYDGKQITCSEKRPFDLSYIIKGSP
jgi:hypothetical protein